MIEERWTPEMIRNFWTKQAMYHSTSPSASWSDVRVMEVEVREISSLLRDGDSVLDVGCANGWSTIQLAIHRAINVVGIDYIKSMVDSAHQTLRGLKKPVGGSIDFEQGNILALRFPSDSFDKVVCVRVIINLGDWHTQSRGMRECVRVLRSGGTLLLSEATVDGWSRLNAMRGEWGLPPIPMPPFNTYLNQRQVVDLLSDQCDLVEVRDFASTYFVGTRVLKPLMAKLAGLEELVADPMCEFNRWMSAAPAWGDYGTQKLFIFRKR